MKQPIGEELKMKYLILLLLLASCASNSNVKSISSFGGIVKTCYTDGTCEYNNTHQKN